MQIAETLPVFPVETCSKTYVRWHIQYSPNPPRAREKARPSSLVHLDLEERTRRPAEETISSTLFITNYIFVPHKQVAMLSMQKFSSNVIEKCMDRASEEVIVKYVHELADPAAMRPLLQVSAPFLSVLRSSPAVHPRNAFLFCSATSRTSMR